ncbi:hypothetical protein E2C01_026954 [Portunus trituberculatus]|uniref:Uncharacterized protein n=1 Tax=Portunus trituberculatus TaxID=210409 RepID=A0A5B7EKD7_PORTR|nr:hypothetical protein [Portunus trituberculatus]
MSHLFYEYMLPECCDGREGHLQHLLLSIRWRPRPGSLKACTHLLPPGKRAQTVNSIKAIVYLQA